MKYKFMTKYIGLLVPVLFMSQANAAMVAYGSDGSGLNLNVGQIINEPSGGVTSPGFSGTLFLEVFDSDGGESSLASGAIAGTGGDFTYVFQLVMDADGDGETAIISNINFNAFMLGTGDFNLVGSTSGGSFGSSMTYQGNSITPSFTFDSGLGEGAISDVFWFTQPLLDITETGTSSITFLATNVGDALVFSLGTTVASSANATMQVIPVPAAVWLFGSGFLGLLGFARRRK